RGGGRSPHALRPGAAALGRRGRAPVARGGRPALRHRGAGGARRPAPLRHAACGAGGSGMELTAPLHAYLKTLCLPTIRDCYPEVVQQAVQETLSYEQFLLELLAREALA